MVLGHPSPGIEENFLTVHAAVPDAELTLGSAVGIQYAHGAGERRARILGKNGVLAVDDVGHEL